MSVALDSRMKESAPIAPKSPGRPRTGHRGRLRLSFGGQQHRTVLRERFSSAPFGTVRANYPDSSGTPEVEITNPSGGILGGDHLEMDVAVEARASATVIIQAANKAYRGAESSQQAIFRVEDGAFLEYLPHHLIPYKGSDYRQTTVFHLAPEATFITWDAFAAGRVVRGERFEFTRLRSRMEIHRGDIPEAIDGFDLPGGSEPFGGYSYSATAYALAPRDLGPLAENVHLRLGGMVCALASASAPASGLCGPGSGERCASSVPCPEPLQRYSARNSGACRSRRARCGERR